MKRITKKLDGTGNYEVTDDYSDEDAIRELGRQEDIEDELGIDIKTLAKLITSDVYVKDGLGDIVCIKNYGCGFTINLTEKAINLSTNFYFCDYGKTWALTEKELTK